MHKFQEEDQILFEAIEAYKNGDRDKATVIYESTKKYTFNILHKAVEKCKSQGILTSDVISITEDVMQELYIVFFNDIANFRNEDPKSIFKWISVVAHRRLSTYVKENGTEVLQFEKNEDYREENDIWDSSEINDSDMESHHELLPEAALEDKEFRQLIMDFVQALPEAQAQTILLHFRGGMKYQEIADEMGVSLITVKTRMKKAKDSLEEIINKYEEKTGTKLHSVSILPLLWLLYRMSSENTTVPVAVDAAVTSSIAEASSLAGASGTGIGGATTAGSIGTIGATTATKAISTRVLLAIVSTAVVIGGVAVGSQIVDKKQETTIEQGDSEDKEKDNSNDNKQDNEGGDDTSSKGNTDTENDETADSDTNNQTQGENNGSDTVTNNNGTGENTNGAESNTGAGENANGTGSNTNNSGTGNNSGTQGNTNNSGNDSGNSDSGNESTAAKGTKENPYRIGEKIVVTDDISYHSSENNPSVYHLELTVTDYTPIEQSEPVYVQSMNNTVYLNVVKAKIKIIGEGTEAYSRTPIGLGLVESNGNGYGWSGEIFDQSGNLMNQVYNNVEYDIGFHYSKSAYQEGKDYIYFEILFSVHGETATQYIYVKLE